ncbi:12932_t:CDS:10, partial [Dentiscutata erythropus]
IQLIPECLNALKYQTFWENTKEPTLFDFLNFRLSTGVLDDKRTEYSQYKNKLTTINKFYAEASDCKSLSAPTTLQPVMLVVGKSVMSVVGKSVVPVNKQCLTNYFGTCYARKEFNDKRSKVINNFWDCQDVNAKAEMVAQHATIAKVTTEQVQQYAISTTTGIAKRFLDNNKETTNRVKAHKTNSEKIDHADETNHDGFRTPPHQIVSNTCFSSSFQSIMITSNENILRVLAESLATINDSKFLEFKEHEKNNKYFCAYDDVMDIRGDSDFANVESFNKPIPDISASNTSERHYWSEFGHRFFSKMLQDFVELDWRRGGIGALQFETHPEASNVKFEMSIVMEFKILRKNKNKAEDLLAWLWETEE